MSFELTKRSNGLRIASEQLPGVQTVTLCVACNVGARAESKKEHGVSHLLEHMAFKGTKTRSARQIAEEFDDIGGHINAYTSMEQTVYYARILKQHLPIAVEILADILQNSVFAPEELAKEKEVIIQEIAQHHDTAEDLVFDILHETIYPNHPLGRSILGTVESVRSLSRDNIFEYMTKHYNAVNMVIAAAGNIQHSELEKLVDEYFSDISTNKVNELDIATFKAGKKSQINERLEQMQIMLAYPAISILDSKYYAAQLLSTIFGGGMSSRLFQQIREKHGLAYNIQSFLTCYQDNGFFGIYAATTADKANKLIELAKIESQKLLYDITEEEINRAKCQQIANLLMRRENVTSVAEWIARHLHDYGKYRPADQIIAEINKVTIAELQLLAQQFFSTDNVAMATLGPAAVVEIA